MVMHRRVSSLAETLETLKTPTHQNPNIRRPSVAEEVGFEPTATVTSRTAFRERHLKPLGHPSGANYTIEHGPYSGSPPAANLGFKMHEFIESLMRCRHHEIVSYGLVEARGLNPATSIWKSRMLSASCATSSPA